MIDTVNLTKKFGSLTAVDSLTLDVGEGEIFGLLGPNGAGKTTLISMLITLIPPTSGKATVNGFDVVHRKTDVRKSIGIVFQEPSVDDLLTGRENLELHTMLYFMPREIRKKRIEEVLSLVDLTERADDVVRTYSGGMRRRLELARGLMHHPKVLFLDEPTLGLDPSSRKHIWDYISKLAKEENITIMLTTHYLDEADALCKRIAIIDFGKIVATGSPSKLKHEVGGDIVVIRQKKFNEKRLSGLDFVSGWKQAEDGIEITVKDAHKNLQRLLSAVGEIESVEVREASLNDVFMKYTGKQYREEEGEGGWAERVMASEGTRQ